MREGWRRGQKTNLKVAAANRDVDILPPIRRALEQQRLIAGASELVFPNPRGGHINVSNLRRRVWYTALEKAGVKRRDLYNTRHWKDRNTIADRQLAMVQTSITGE